MKETENHTHAQDSPLLSMSMVLLVSCFCPFAGCPAMFLGRAGPSRWEDLANFVLRCAGKPVFHVFDHNIEAGGKRFVGSEAQMREHEQVGGIE